MLTGGVAAVSHCADSILFIAADVAALVVQSIGGAKASAADTLASANKGARTMVVGIIMQMGEQPHCCSPKWSS